MPPRSDPLELFIFDPRTDRRRATPSSSGGPADVAKILATYRNARVLEDLPFHGGEAGGRFQRILDRQQAIRAFVDGDSLIARLPSEKQLRTLGQDLFESLFPGDVRRLYDSSRSQSGGRRLDIVLTSTIGWVAELPWEFAFDPARGAFLATEEVHFVRNVLTAVPAEEIAPRKRTLSILVVVAAQPLGWEPLSADEEVVLLRRGFQSLIETGRLTLEVLTDATPDALHQRLNEAQVRGRTFDVVHFIGHGELDERRGVGVLVFEDRAGRSQHVDAATLREMVGHRGVRLLFLNACETARGGRSDFNRGVAQALVASGVPVVVGNQYKVLDPSATTFAGTFYSLLAQGAPVGYAAREARVAMRYLVSGMAIDWAVPVVFTQDPGQALCRPAAGHSIERRAATGATAVGSAARRRRRSSASRIGFWDVNGFLPSLNDMTARLTAAQDLFSFETIELAAPLGTWRLERSLTRPAQGYVYAESVTARFRELPEKLGLQKLLCVTSLPLGDRDLVNLYRWDHAPGGRVAVLSLAGFGEDFARLRLRRERAIANFVAGCLAGISWHIGGIQNCPCFFNGQRDPLIVAGPLALCPPCHRSLARARRGTASPDLLKALEAILAVDWTAAPKRRVKP